MRSPSLPSHLFLTSMSSKCLNPDLASLDRSNSSPQSAEWD